MFVNNHSAAIHRYHKSDDIVTANHRSFTQKPVRFTSLIKERRSIPRSVRRLRLESVSGDPFRLFGHNSSDGVIAEQPMLSSPLGSMVSKGSLASLKVGPKGDLRTLLGDLWKSCSTKPTISRTDFSFLCSKYTSLRGNFPPLQSWDYFSRGSDTIEPVVFMKFWRTTLAPLKLNEQCVLLQKLITEMSLEKEICNFQTIFSQQQSPISHSPLSKAEHPLSPTPQGLDADSASSSVYAALTSSAVVAAATAAAVASSSSVDSLADSNQQGIAPGNNNIDLQRGSMRRGGAKSLRKGSLGKNLSRRSDQPRRTLKRGASAKRVRTSSAEQDTLTRTAPLTHTHTLLLCFHGTRVSGDSYTSLLILVLMGTKTQGHVGKYHNTGSSNGCWNEGGATGDAYPRV
jgi:hypothetical protein